MAVSRQIRGTRFVSEIPGLHYIPHFAMPAVFDNANIAFAYPENWRIEESDGVDSCPNVTVASPKTAFWSLNAYPAKTDTKRLLAEAVEALRGDYPELDVEQVVEPVESVSLEGIEVHFILMEFVVRARIQVFDYRERTYLLLCQAEDDEFEAIAPVFQAMTTSLLRGDAAQM